jgi:hypothetical protein
VELRCPSEILHGVVDDNIIEVRCRSNWCGHRAGTVVIHRFDLKTGECVSTLCFKDPTSKKGSANGSARSGVPIRSA